MWKAWVQKDIDIWRRIWAEGTTLMNTIKIGFVVVTPIISGGVATGDNLGFMCVSRHNNLWLVGICILVLKYFE